MREIFKLDVLLSRAEDCMRREGKEPWVCSSSIRSAVAANAEEVLDLISEYIVSKIFKRLQHTSFYSQEITSDPATRLRRSLYELSRSCCEASTLHRVEDHNPSGLECNSVLCSTIRWKDRSGYIYLLVELSLSKIAN